MSQTLTLTLLMGETDTSLRDISDSPKVMQPQPGESGMRSVPVSPETTTDTQPGESVDLSAASPEPLTKSLARTLRAGQRVLLTGSVFTARDATHERILDYLAQHGAVPAILKGQLLFYAGPTPARAGRPHGSVGPTTASRMDEAAIALMQHGIFASMGKGSRSQAYTAAAIKYGAVYFGAIGGAAALLAQHVTASEPVAWPELGTEALVRLELKDFPAFVAIDAHGTDIYETGEASDFVQRLTRSPEVIQSGESVDVSKASPDPSIYNSDCTTTSVGTDAHNRGPREEDLS